MNATTYQIYTRRRLGNVFRLDCELSAEEIVSRIHPWFSKDSLSKKDECLGYQVDGVQLTRVFTERVPFDDQIEEWLGDDPPYEQFQDTKAGEFVLVIYRLRESPGWIADLVHLTSQTEGELIAEFRPERVP